VPDSSRIKAMRLPVFCVGRRPYDSCGRGIVVDDVPIVIDGVAIRPGDLVLETPMVLSSSLARWSSRC
jgi:regulator of RNase E activity RraA